MTGRRNPVLLSTFRRDGSVELSLQEAEVQQLGEGDVLLEVEASPVNPSDVAQLLGPIDIETLETRGSGVERRLTGRFKGEHFASVTARMDEPVPLGNEGAGTVVEAGPSARHLVGRKVAVMGGPLYTRYRRVPAAACVPLPDGVPAEMAASMFLNPLTALSMVETMRLDGHWAIVHTAAASNLGQMLVRICNTDGIGLVNIVRRAEHITLLRGLGAKHVLNSQDPDFQARLIDAIAATGAMLAFDAIGGGGLAGSILDAMEAVASKGLTQYSPYGTTTFKQVYVYGSLNRSPTTFSRTFGLAWSISGYLVIPALARIGEDGVKRMQHRILAELDTTFASHYTETISLADLLDASKMKRIARMSTGEKYLVDPRR
jgi:NADPH:quinone reductase-like Zn-dependent oxidoreductase